MLRFIPFPYVAIFVSADTAQDLRPGGPNTGRVLLTVLQAGRPAGSASGEGSIFVLHTVAFLLCVCADRWRDRGIKLFGVSFSKGTNPTMRVLSSSPHLNLITSQRPHLHSLETRATT